MPRGTNWGPETHAQLLSALFGSGQDQNLNLTKGGLEEIIAAWPLNRGSAPSVSGLSQQITAIRKQARSNSNATLSSGGSTSSVRATASGPCGIARRISKSTRPSGGKSGQEAHFVNLMDANSEDDEEKLMQKPQASPTPEGRASNNARRRNLLARAASKPIPRGGLSPSTGLFEKYGDMRETSPDVFKETTFTGKAGADCLANDPFAKMPMYKRVKALKKKNMDDWKAKYCYGDDEA